MKQPKSTKLPPARAKLPDLKLPGEVPIPAREFSTRLGYCVRVSPDGAVWRMTARGQEIIASGQAGAEWLRDHVSEKPSRELYAAISCCEVIGAAAQRTAEFMAAKKALTRPGRPKKNKGNAA